MVTRKRGNVSNASLKTLKPSLVLSEKRRRVKRRLASVMYTGTNSIKHHILAVCCAL